jgi:gamma-glutamyltranspeptidase/glutathione hydrolase
MYGTARAKGLFPRTVILKHALRNALMPIVTLTTLLFGELLGGAVLTEQVFSIPGFGKMSFGLMGGPMQAQGHLQMMMRILRYKQNPQAAADAPRWRIESGLKVAVERSFDPHVVEGLRAKGHDIDVEDPSGVFAFGGAQIIQRTAHGYVGGTDPRKDGLVAAY